MGRETVSMPVFQRLRRLYMLAITLLFCIIFIEIIPYFGSSLSISRSSSCQLPVTPPHIPSSHASSNCPLLSASHPQAESSHTKLASALSPAELLCRSSKPLPGGIPKLLHQSWKSTELPAKFKNGVTHVAGSTLIGSGFYGLMKITSSLSSNTSRGSRIRF